MIDSGLLIKCMNKTSATMISRVALSHSNMSSTTGRMIHAVHHVQKGRPLALLTSSFKDTYFRKESMRSFSETPRPKVSSTSSMTTGTNWLSLDQNWTPLALLGVGAGALYYYNNRPVPAAPPVQASTVVVAERQVGPRGMDWILSSLISDMKSALSQLSASCEAKFQADEQEIRAAFEQDRFAIQRAYDETVFEAKADYANAVSQATTKKKKQDDDSILEIKTDHAQARNNVETSCEQTLKSYRMDHAAEMRKFKMDTTKKIKAVRDASIADRQAALAKLSQAQTEAQRKYSADLDAANHLVEQAEQDAHDMAVKFRNNAISKAWNQKAQADDAALREEENGVAQATRAKEAIMAAGERALKKYEQVMDEYKSAVLTAHSICANQKVNLAKANLGNADHQSFVDAMKMLDNTRNMAISAADKARSAALKRIETTKQQAIDKAMTKVDDTNYSTLGGIANALYSLKSAAVDEAKKDGKSILSKLNGEKQQVVDWYNQAMNTASDEYEKETAAIKDKYNKAYYEAKNKTGEAKEKALRLIQDEREADEAMAAKIKKEAADKAEKWKEYTDKKIADMEAYFTDSDEGGR